VPDAPSPVPGTAATLEEWRKITAAATEGPWWYDESEDCWRLHGVAFRVPPHMNPDGSVLIPEQVMNKQIAKAPKHGTPYAEYWPDPADALAWMKRCAGSDATDDPKALYKLLGRRMHPDMPDGNAELWERLDAAATLLGVRNGV
jgi:hypothetical protein